MEWFAEIPVFVVPGKARAAGDSPRAILAHASSVRKVAEKSCGMRGIKIATLKSLA
jgi:hypothetical protein